MCPPDFKLQVSSQFCPKYSQPLQTNNEMTHLRSPHSKKFRATKLICMTTTPHSTYTSYLKTAQPCSFPDSSCMLKASLEITSAPTNGIVILHFHEREEDHSLCKGCRERQRLTFQTSASCLGMAWPYPWSSDTEMDSSVLLHQCSLVVTKLSESLGAREC